MLSFSKYLWTHTPRKILNVFWTCSRCWNRTWSWTCHMTALRSSVGDWLSYSTWYTQNSFIGQQTWWFFENGHCYIYIMLYIRMAIKMYEHFEQVFTEILQVFNRIVLDFNWIDCDIGNNTLSYTIHLSDSRLDGFVKIAPLFFILCFILAWLLRCMKTLNKFLPSK